MRALVTGGGGFLGSAVVRRLVERRADVASLTRSPAPALDALGVETIRGDIADRKIVDAAVAGADVVFHVAAKAGIWGSNADYFRTNVLGTQNVVAACLSAGVPKLVHTSTPSVVHAGTDIAGGDERLPYPARFESPYPATKAAAERIVLAANGEALATVSLRPHLIWGPGDTQLIPRIVDRARRHQLRIIGDGRALVDTTYIDNAVDAHLLAADRLAIGAPCAGRPYFVSQGDPRPVAEIVNQVLDAAGLPPVKASVPFAVAYVAGAVAEIVFRVLGRTSDPPLTRFLVRQLATAHWFDISAARRDLGYAPGVSIAEGLARLRRHYQEQGGTPGSPSAGTAVSVEDAGR